MTYLIPKEAKAFKCPLARTFDAGKAAHCDGPDCIAWRWREIRTGDPLLVSAINREMACLAQDDGKGAAAVKFHKHAVANVTADPAAYGVVSTKGCCGLAGKP